MSEIPEDVMKAAIAAVSQDGWSIDGKSAYSDPGDSVIAMIEIIPIARAIMAERERSRTALSEAEQRARREALEEAAKVAEDEDGHFTLWGQDCNTRVSQKTAADAASRIRALIPSEPHDAEGREKPRRGDPSIFDDAEGRN